MCAGPRTAWATHTRTQEYHGHFGVFSTCPIQIVSTLANGQFLLLFSRPYFDVAVVASPVFLSFSLSIFVAAPFKKKTKEKTKKKTRNYIISGRFVSLGLSTSRIYTTAIDILYTQHINYLSVGLAEKDSTRLKRRKKKRHTFGGAITSSYNCKHYIYTLF